MTIAMCFVTPEGVVLGADSTASIPMPPSRSGYHYLNHNQKLFEIGQGGTLGMLTWGMAYIDRTSYRTLLAVLYDKMQQSPPDSVEDVARRWIGTFWPVYRASSGMQRWLQLNKKNPYDGNESQDNRTKEEESEYLEYSDDLRIGFCIGGYVLPNRTPRAYKIECAPDMNEPFIGPIERCEWFGQPAIISRIIHGCSSGLKNELMASKKWSGTDDELALILNRHVLPICILSIREAIDFVHAFIYITIKTFKFSIFHQVCGGPIEIAVITSDRPFRWVRHKQMDTAIEEGVY